MRTRRHLFTAALLAGTLAACGDDARPSSTGERATGPTAPASSGSERECPADGGGELETTKLYIEHNATDEDTGVHGVLGGEGWRLLCVYFPDGSEMLVADPLDAFDTLAVADLLFESREPENAEVPIDDIRGWFPEGEYRIATIDHEGAPMVGSAWLTHDIPREPDIVAPDLADDPESAAGARVPVDDLLVEWLPVTETIDGEVVTITGYEVIVTDEEYEDPHGNSQPIYDVHVGPEATSSTVPADFLRADTVYELEVLAVEESGNQTIGLGFFSTE